MNLQANEPLISLLAANLVCDAGRYRVRGRPCPKCGATHIRTLGASALYQVAGNYPRRPIALKAIAFAESQVLELLHSSDLRFVEVEIDRLGRPLARWNVRPTVAERGELEEAQRAYRADAERRVEQELRELRREKLAAAGLH